MTEFRKALCDRMIKLYGFENQFVLSFCAICEEDSALNDKTLEELVKAHEEYPEIFKFVNE